jgi:hypothetical protein
VLKSYFASIISVRSTPLWKKGRSQIQIRTSDYWILIRIVEAQKHADPDPQHWQQYGHPGCIHFHRQQCRCAGCTPFTTINMDVQDVFLSAISSTDVQGVSLSSLAVWMCRVYVFINAGLSSIRSVRYRTEQNVPLRYWDNGNQFGTGMLHYRTEIQDAGMPMHSYGR